MAKLKTRKERYASFILMYSIIGDYIPALKVPSTRGIIFKQVPKN